MANNNNNNNNNAAVGKLLADLAIVPPAAFTPESKHTLHKASAQAKCPSLKQAVRRVICWVRMPAHAWHVTIFGTMSD